MQICCVCTETSRRAVVCLLGMDGLFTPAGTVSLKKPKICLGSLAQLNTYYFRNLKQMTWFLLRSFEHVRQAFVPAEQRSVLGMSTGLVCVGYDGQCTESVSNNPTISLDLSKIEDGGLTAFLATAPELAERVKTISLRRSHLSPKEYISLSSVILQDRLFGNLLRLDLSYVNLPEICLNFLCDYLSPLTAGYNITSLDVTRCNLGTHGATKLLTALFANITLTDINLTGNDIQDGSLPTLVTVLTKYTNQVQTIGLGANKLTSEGVRILSSVLQASTLSLHTLLLPNNPDIGDDALEDLFVALNKSSTVTTLSLSNCGIHNCDFTRYWPFMNKLETLDLSFNLIDDGEFVKLCKNLELCYCLRHLQLGHNRFGGLKSNVIEHALVNNGALRSLSLAGNRCADAVWTAVYRGLLHNRVLLQLDLAECNITISNALTLGRAFVRNDTCTLQLQNNPLPADMVTDPREYYIAHQQRLLAQQASNADTNAETRATPTPTSEGPRRRRLKSIIGQARDSEVLAPTGNTGTGNAPASTNASAALATPLHLNPAADKRSIAASQEWCDRRTKVIALSLHTLSIVAERKPHIGALTNPEDDNLSHIASLAAESVVRERTESHGGGGGDVAILMRAASAASLASTQRLHHADSAPAPSTAAPTIDRASVAVTNPEIIAQSEVYLSPEALQGLVAESDLANTSETRLMHVAYGRAPLVIGHIELTSLTTFAQVDDVHQR